jgi:GDP-L-fucose synthase
MTEFGQNFSLKRKKIWVAGHRGMVGAALVRRLESEDCEILTAPRTVDLRRQDATENWMRANKPDVVVIAAAKVGGILANSKCPADFLYDNMMIAGNIIRAAHEMDVEKLLFLGSSCIYPKFASQPITEDALLTGVLEPTNEAYAIAKIAGMKLCEAYRRQYGRDFISAMPCNLYGPGDNFDAENSHVIPALIRKAFEAKIVGAKNMTVWGSGTPRREFLYVEDLADALAFMLKNYSGLSHVNVGAGEDVSIADLAAQVAAAAGFKGGIIFDTSKPDGTPRKLMDSSRIFTAGWRPRTLLGKGLEQACAWYEHQLSARRAA